MKTSDKGGMKKENMKKEEEVCGKKKDERFWEDFNEHVGVSIEPGGPSLERKSVYLWVC